MNFGNVNVVERKFHRLSQVLNDGRRRSCDLSVFGEMAVLLHEPIVHVKL